jgi:ribosome-interacting GTPase 1
MRKGVDIGDVCDKLHRSFRKDFRYARIWGKSAKHEGQKVSINHILADEDILQIIKEF